MKNILLLAGFTWREAWSKRLILLVLLLTLVFVGLFLYGANLLEQRLAERAAEIGSDRTRTATLAQASLVSLGLYVVNFLGGLMGALAAVGAISGELETGTILSLAPKPIRRLEIVLGKWLGFATVTVLYVILLSGALIVGAWLISGFLPPNPVAAVALLCVNALMLLTLTMLGSTLFSTLANGVTVFMLYGFAWVGGIIGTIGKATDTPLMERISQVSAVLQPSDALWRAASYYLQPETVIALQRNSRIGGNPFAGIEPPSVALLVWVAVYTLVALGAAVWVFSRRDV